MQIIDIDVKYILLFIEYSICSLVGKISLCRKLLWSQ